MAAKVTVRNNGPLTIEGEFAICDADGGEYGLSGRTAIALCRCGHSARKPFCDGNHKQAGFQSVEKAHELPPPVVPKPS